jgi:GLPGLI family protein
MIPEFQTSKSQLFYTENESLYKPIIEDEVEDVNTQRGGFRFRGMQQNTEIYFNQTESTGLTSQEFFGKQYLISDSLKTQPWKFGEGTKVIAGYECKMAYYTDDSNPERILEITAWYTDKIRPFLGPDRYYTFPATVLAVDVNNGERVTVAQKVEIRSLKKNELKAPSKGEPVTQAEFRKIMEDQMQQMRQQGGGRQMMIRN